jgi:hypothetical protein
MLTISYIDILQIIFCLAGIILPQFSAKSKYAGAIVIATMFLVSFAGAWVVHALDPKQTFSAVNARLFSLIGISHIVFISVQSSMYWKLIFQRVGFYKKEEEP